LFIMSFRTLLASSCAILVACLLPSVLVSANTTPAAQLASLYSLTTSTTFAFPTSTLSSSDAEALFLADWSLSKGKLENGVDDLSFVEDPFPDNQVPGSNGTSPDGGIAMQVNYPAGSFSNATGGAQFYSLWNSTTPFQSMLVSYEIAFDEGFNWVKGGKLPGLRGGPVLNGCDGGKQPNGSDCFSARLMWRTDGEGEVYAYIPQTDLCNDSGIICNSDFGISVDRGSFSFPSGQWSRISLLVQLNSPPSESNGFVAMYFNDVAAISQSGLQMRSSSAATAGGLFFSTFFGGNDSTWATPVDTHTYFRNFQLWGSFLGSNSTTTVPAPAATGTSSPAKSASKRSKEWGWGILSAAIVLYCGVNLA